MADLYGSGRVAVDFAPAVNSDTRDWYRCVDGQPFGVALIHHENGRNEQAGSEAPCGPTWTDAGRDARKAAGTVHGRRGRETLEAPSELDVELVGHLSRPSSVRNRSRPREIQLATVPRGASSIVATSSCE